MTVEAGVTAVPVSAFYDGSGPTHFIRFCFSKRDAVLDGALDRLARWIGRRGKGAARLPCRSARRGIRSGICQIEGGPS